MKFDLAYLERGYAANLYRVRAVECLRIAATRSASSTKQELEQEADYCETQAQKLDNCAETNGDKAATVKGDPSIDLNYLDPKS